jgi:5'-3' exonuclease
MFGAVANDEGGNSNEVEDALAELDEETVVFEGGLKAKSDSEYDFAAMAAASEKFNEQRNRPRDEEEEEEYDDDSWKNWYYRDKFRIGLENEEYHKHLRTSYLEGLVWVLRYYYRGCCSWNWFFPFHYAPLCSGTLDPSHPTLRV